MHWETQKFMSCFIVILLYCSICFIVVVQNWTHNISEAYLYTNRSKFLLQKKLIRNGLYVDLENLSVIETTQGYYLIYKIFRNW